MRLGATATTGTVRRFCLGGTALLLGLVVAACGGSSSTSSTTTQASSGTPKAGGTLTVLEWTGFSGDWPAGLDPATNINGAADQSQMDAIFGELFELGPKGKIIPDLATGYKFSNGGKSITITLRQGVKFTDGTPFNADAVAWNLKRDLKSSCTCKPTWPVTSVTATGPSTVQINLSAPDGAFINQIFDSIANWIASPTAVQKMGQKAFAAKPVGAGPFIVVSDTFSSQLVLKRNPHYWQAGRPYLDQLIFKTVGGDEAAYEAMLAHQGQVYEGMSTPALIKQAAQHFNVVNQSPTTVYDLQLNTLNGPFKDKLARQAIYAATNIAPILQHIFGNQYPIAQGFTGPGGICNQPKVPGYPGYDLAKAKALVKQLGGLTVSLGTIQNLVAQQTTEALQTEWAAAGIKATIHTYPLAALIAQFTSGKWRRFLRPGGRRRGWLQVPVHVAVQRRARPAPGLAAEPGHGRAQPEPAVHPVQPGRQLHRPELLRPVLLRVRPCQRRGQERDGPRRHPAVADRSRPADHPVGGRGLHQLDEASLHQLDEPSLTAGDEASLTAGDGE
jgi:peptide/nickel transport system substrate-binding protein